MNYYFFFILKYFKLIINSTYIKKKICNNKIKANIYIYIYKYHYIYLYI